MPRGRKPRTWVRLDCEGVLRGSINYLLPLDGQAVWVKMIALAEVCGGRPGFIEDNNQHGLPHEYIAQELHCPLEVFEDVLKKMGDDGAVRSNGTGSIELVNFKHYQFSEYDRQKPYRDKKKQEESEAQAKQGLEDLLSVGKDAKKQPPEWQEWRKTVFAKLSERRKYPITPNIRAGEAKQMTWLFQNGYKPDDIILAYDTLKAQDFWKDKALTLMSVAKQIGTIAEGGGNNGAHRGYSQASSVKAIPGNRPGGAFDDLR